MESSNTDKAHTVEFLKEKGFTKNRTQNVFRRFESIEESHVRDNWNYLKSMGIQEKKLPHIVSKCPRILTLSLDNKLLSKLMPTVHCLETLGSKPRDVAAAIAKFPSTLVHSVEDKLWSSVTALRQFSEILDFLEDCGLDQDGIIGRILVKHPFIIGYSFERRLSPTTGFLKSIGLSELDLKKTIAVLVTEYPPVLIRSIKNCMEPRIRFLVGVMGRDISEIVEYPQYFRH
ncbi:uncharacterized protein A4U43_C05F15770 [Asparagus officinalis]|uniref:Uncharacterized protein n=1 Tax=Asparagus officinalis TaxID=4686 RepID=A0A5P1ERV5_ASPOF|nr:uncharacterized protein A4U43_C05F15770 [Asparagus officinalis]